MRAVLRVLLAFVWLGGSAAFAATPEETYRAAHQRLNEEFDGFDAEAEAPSPTVRAFWDAVDGLLSARGPEGLATASKDDQFLTIKSAPLGSGILAVAVSKDQLGHLAVLDHGRIRWSSSTDPAAPGCWRGAPERPCSGIEIGLLSAEAGDVPRFYVEAAFAQDAGATRGFQFSVWRWKGEKAQVVFSTNFAMGGDSEAQGIAVDGDEVKITGKGFWNNFSVCGACDGRQRLRRLHVTPIGIEDLGITSLTPELDAVDALLGRLAEHRATNDIATPEAAALLNKSWNGNIFLIDPPVTANHIACMAPEDLPPLTFRFAPGPTATRIIAVEPGPCR